MAVAGLIPETSPIWRAKCQKCYVEGLVDAPKAALFPKWRLVTGLLGLGLAARCIPVSMAARPHREAQKPVSQDRTALDSKKPGWLTSSARDRRMRLFGGYPLGSVIGGPELTRSCSSRSAKTVSTAVFMLS